MRQQTMFLSLLLLIMFLAGCTKTRTSVEPGISGSWTKPAGLSSFNNVIVSGSYLFAGGDHGVFRSTDNGSSWVKADSGLPLSGSYVIAEHSNILIAGDNGNGFRNGVFVSTDRGISWIPRDSGLAVAVGVNQVVDCIVVVGADVFVGTSPYGIFKSANDGISWTHVDSVPGNVLSFIIVGTDIFAGLTPDGVFKSTDDGTTWSAANNGISQYADGPMWIYSLATYGDKIFAGANEGKIFLSKDHGSSWTNIALGLPITPQSAVHMAAFDSTIIAGIDSGLFKSTNLGTTWTNVTDNLSNAEIARLSIIGTVAFVETNDGQVWRRTF